MINEWLEKYQVYIAIGLVVFIVVGGVILLFEEQRDKLTLAAKTPMIEKENWEQEKEELTNRITELEKKVATLEANPVASSQGQVAGVKTTSAETGGLINLNTADVAALDTLPGIGESKAKAIIAYRDSHGGFKNIDELKEVKGIGESTFEKLKSMVTVK